MQDQSGIGRYLMNQLVVQMNDAEEFFGLNVLGKKQLFQPFEAAKEDLYKYLKAPFGAHGAQAGVKNNLHYPSPQNSW